MLDLGGGGNCQVRTLKAEEGRLDLTHAGGNSKSRSIIMFPFLSHSHFGKTKLSGVQYAHPPSFARVGVSVDLVVSVGSGGPEESVAPLDLVVWRSRWFLSGDGSSHST